MHQYLWERSCGWYLKGDSGEQQGPLDMADLNKRLPAQRMSCWCEGFSKWLPYEQAIAMLQQDELCPEFDAVQYHISQVCFLHSRATEALDHTNAALSIDKLPAEETFAEFTLGPALEQQQQQQQQQQQEYPFEVLEAMWSTVLQRRS
jgi:hypothetical protein